MPDITPPSTQPKRLLPLWEGRILLIASGLALTFIMALLLVYQPLPVQQAELRLYDYLLSGRSSPPTSGVPVLVGIDEESLQAYGQWPWPRYRLAKIVERLHALADEQQLRAGQQELGLGAVDRRSAS